MKNTTSTKKPTELYEKGKHIRVVPKVKNDVYGAFEGTIEDVNGSMIVIAPDNRPHKGYRISLPWVDIKIGRYKLIFASSENAEAGTGGDILL
jgi:hypothetical protein